MIKIFKMDMHRLLHSKVFYVSIAFITVMAFSMVISGMSTSLEGLMGVTGASMTGDDFMNASMGTGVIFILLSIILSIFVCGDYSGGYAKNIFSSHSNPWDYIGGKMLSMAAASGFLIALYTIEAILSLAILGNGVVLTGGVIGLVFFILQKWLLSCALCAVVLLVALFTRNLAWSMTAGFLIATGGLTMGIALFAGAFGLDWMVNVFSVTISGSSQICTLTFNGLTFIRVLLASVGWTVAASTLSRKVLLTKDI